MQVLCAGPGYQKHSVNNICDTERRGEAGAGSRITFPVLSWTLAEGELCWPISASAGDWGCVGKEERTWIGVVSWNGVGGTMSQGQGSKERKDLIMSLEHLV